MAPMIEKAI